jgi:excisionase family DNA binding protein
MTMNEINTSVRRVALSVREFCAAVGCSKTHFYEAVSRGQIRTVKFGRRTLVPACEAEALIERLAAASGEGVR